MDGNYLGARKRPNAPDAFTKHRLLCGTAAQFQGDERDVIFLSMVDGPPEEGRHPFRGEGPAKRYKKRYNVAVSRARNQLWVVHSLDPEAHLKEGDLRRRLIQHARDPGALMRSLEEQSARTESELERRVLRRLVNAGFRVRAQWPVGGYRIDLVVEGAEARLAVECDGERFHPPDKLLEDMQRQADLERLGWRFARIRGSVFFRDPAGAMAPVMAKLERRMGIVPLGEEPREPEGDKYLVERLRREAEAIRREQEGERDRETSFEAEQDTDLDEPLSGQHRRPKPRTPSDLEGGADDDGVVEPEGTGVLESPPEGPNAPEPDRPRDSRWERKRRRGYRHREPSRPGDVVEKKEESEKPKGAVTPATRPVEEATPTPAIGTDPIPAPKKHMAGLQEAPDPAPFRERRPRPVTLDPVAPSSSGVAPYVAFEGPAGPDPRKASSARVAEGLCRIIDTEGPMLVRRAYNLYLSGIGIARMGRQLKRAMNRALQRAIQQGRIAKEDELGTGGLINSIVRIRGRPATVLRERGPRTFEEIPPSELGLMARRLSNDGTFESGSDDHLRAVLEAFDLQRLTVQRRLRFPDELGPTDRHGDDVQDGGQPS